MTTPTSETLNPQLPPLTAKERRQAELARAKERLAFLEENTPPLTSLAKRYRIELDSAINLYDFQREKLAKKVATARKKCHAAEKTSCKALRELRLTLKKIKRLEAVE